MIKKKTILFIDDDEMLLMLYAKFAENLGLIGHTAPDALTAIQRLKDGSPLPDLIITDLEMPGLSPKLFIEQLRDDMSLKHIKVVILSAGGHLSEIAAAYGADSYLEKPLTMPQLKVQVNALELVTKG